MLSHVIVYGGEMQSSHSASTRSHNSKLFAKMNRWIIQKKMIHCTLWSSSRSTNLRSLKVVHTTKSASNLK